MQSAVGEQPGVIFIAAPVGYGKSSLAAAFGTSCFSRCIWLSLVEGDGGSAGLEAPLLKACAQAGFAADAGSGWEELFAGAGALCVVLDDYHHASRGSTGTVFELFNALPPGSVMLICSEEEHVFPLSSLRMEERVTELRSSDLAANEEEIGLFLSLFGTGAEPEVRGLILRKTGGWWACIRLFALTWQKLKPEERGGFLAGFRATDRYIAEFLSEHIHDRLSPAQRSFLGGTSVCSAVNEELASLLTGIGSSEIRTIMQGLERRSFLVPVSHSWYRMPVILRQYYLSSLDTGTRRSLHLLASRWFDGKNMAGQAEYHRRKGEPAKQVGSSPLVRRESEILSLAGQGLSNSGIAERLFISTGTVKWHMNNIFEKLDCHNRTAAVELARRRGFIP